MKIVTRVEFTDAQSGAKESAKLSWISPISERYLFVNRRGLKVSNKPLLALAAEIRCGNVLVLEEVPLFDRALEAIAARLQVGPPSASGIPSTQVA